MSLPSVVRAFVFNPAGEVLLAKHKKDAPWVLPGGHVEQGESLHDAVKRELQEEFSLSVNFFEMDHEEILHHRGKKLQHLPLPVAIYELHYTNESGKDKSRIEYVFLTETNDTIKKIQGEEIVEYAWFEVDDILSMKPNIEIHDFVIEMLEKILGEEDE